MPSHALWTILSKYVNVYMMNPVRHVLVDIMAECFHVRLEQ